MTGLWARRTIIRMDDRWVPLFAAAVGVIGGVGGAAIGGALANEGQEKQSQSERAAAIQDLRIDTYGEYLGSAEKTFGGLQLNVSEDERNKAILQLVAIRARVVLVAEEPEVMRQRAEAITEAVENVDLDAYNNAAQEYLAAARADIVAAED